jgi:type IV pilus assembly protein PilM
MALPFFTSKARKKRDHMLGVDLGSRITKVVHLQRRGNGIALCGYALLDTPIFEKVISADMLTEHLKTLGQTFGAKTKLMALTVGVNDAVVRHVEMPLMPSDDIRLVLKNNSRVYLQQDLTGYVFDCYVDPLRQQPKPAQPAQPAPSAPSAQPASPAKSPATPQKQKILVAGAKKLLVDDFSAAIKDAGFIPDHIVPGILGPANAFEHAMPEVFSRQVVALVDIGFKSSSVCILQEGDLVLNRVVSIGGDRLTTGLAEAMDISYPEAESIKIGIANEVEAVLEPLITPLGRELRASIDFFEHQQDRTVSQVYLCGGSARSDFVIRMLRQELVAECQAWNPTASLELALSPEQAAEIEFVAPQLAVAIGAALTAI